jgi:hypothetical protein
MKKLKEMTNEELQQEFISYDETINKVGCYGTKDLMWLNAIEAEIDRRGGEIVTSSDVVWNNIEDEEDDEVQ